MRKSLPPELVYIKGISRKDIAYGDEAHEYDRLLVKFSTRKKFNFFDIRTLFLFSACLIAFMQSNLFI